MGSAFFSTIDKYIIYQEGIKYAEARFIGFDGKFFVFVDQVYAFKHYIRDITLYSFAQNLN